MFRRFGRRMKKKARSTTSRGCSKSAAPVYFYFQPSGRSAGNPSRSSSPSFRPALGANSLGHENRESRARERDESYAYAQENSAESYNTESERETGG